jgi:hypothetical protein
MIQYRSIYLSKPEVDEEPLAIVKLDKAWRRHVIKIKGKKRIKKYFYNNVDEPTYNMLTDFNCYPDYKIEYIKHEKLLAIFLLSIGALIIILITSLIGYGLAYAISLFNPGWLLTLFSNIIKSIFVYGGFVFVGIYIRDLETEWDGIMEDITHMKDNAILIED